MVKFVLGPITGAAAGLSFWETFGLTTAGMMTTVLVFSLVGKEARVWWQARVRNAKTPRRLFTKANRRVVYIWQHFGLAGIAFFTPIILSPIIGTVLAVSFGEPPRRIVPAMLASAVFWGLALSWFMHLAEHELNASTLLAVG
jgi:uncharacterized membrane protein